MNTPLPPQSAWLRCWTALPREEVLAAATAAREPGWRMQHRQVPCAGLAMLQLREPNQGERFLLGELPLSVAEVGIVLADGRDITGAAQVLADDAELAGALAILDAVLAHGLDAGGVAALLGRGRDLCAVEDARRGGILHQTTVAFSRLELSTDDHHA